MVDFQSIFGQPSRLRRESAHGTHGTHGTHGAHGSHSTYGTHGAYGTHGGGERLFWQCWAKAFCRHIRQWEN